MAGVHLEGVVEILDGKVLLSVFRMSEPTIVPSRGEARLISDGDVVIGDRLGVFAFVKENISTNLARLGIGRLQP